MQAERPTSVQIFSGQTSTVTATYNDETGEVGPYVQYPPGDRKVFSGYSLLGYSVSTNGATASPVRRWATRRGPRSGGTLFGGPRALRATSSTSTSSTSTASPLVIKASRVSATPINERALLAKVTSRDRWNGILRPAFVLRTSSAPTSTAHVLLVRPTPVSHSRKSLRPTPLSSDSTCLQRKPQDTGIRFQYSGQQNYTRRGRGWNSPTASLHRHQDRNL